MPTRNSYRAGADCRHVGNAPTAAIATIEASLPPPVVASPAAAAAAALGASGAAAVVAAAAVGDGAAGGGFARPAHVSPTAKPPVVRQPHEREAASKLRAFGKTQLANRPRPQRA